MTQNHFVRYKAEMKTLKLLESNDRRRRLINPLKICVRAERNKTYPRSEYTVTLRERMRAGQLKKRQGHVHMNARGTVMINRAAPIHGTFT